MTMTLVKEASRKVAPGTHELVILGPDGEKSYAWNDAETTEIAKEAFDRAMGEGYQGYSAPSQGEGEVMRTFDPEAEHLIATQPLVGG